MNIKSLSSRITGFLATEDSARIVNNKLKGISPSVYVAPMIEALYMYTRPKKRANDVNVYLVDTAVSIGKAVLEATRSPIASVEALRLGLFFIEFFEEQEVLKIEKGWRGRHQIYVVKVLKDAVIKKLWTELPKELHLSLPLDTAPEDWTCPIHATRKKIVKTRSKELLASISVDTHPLLFSTLNKSQQVGWRVNLPVLEVQKQCLEEEADVFQDIFENLDTEARKTKLREAETIISIAHETGENVFYHLYNYDFRGRKYCSTKYFHEQGSDIARGLLLRNDKKAVGPDGYTWLLISLANNWAGKVEGTNLKTDKIPPLDRKQWAEKHIPSFLEYAERPMEARDWMFAEKPWQFLAGCMELKKVLDYGLDYESSLECFIDGSNNGAQHLSMLARDEITAPLVNIVPQALPGDLYAYIAEAVWESLKQELLPYGEEIINDCNKFIDKMIELKAKGDFEGVKKLKSRNMALAVISAPVFWNRITDPRDRRKIVKRNVLSLPYGATAYGLGNQQWDDAKKHGIQLLYYLEPKWAYYLGRLVFSTSETLMSRPMRLLRLFENAGEAAENNGMFLEWVVPKTNFPVMQYYVAGPIRKINVKYKTSVLQLHVCIHEEPEKQKGKQAQGAAPNIIHSLDAAHLMLTVNSADFPITTVHDSYGCLLADMPKLYTLVRQTFRDLYKEDILNDILLQVGGESFKDFGSLDVNAILEADYAFI